MQRLGATPSRQIASGRREIAAPLNSLAIFWPAAHFSQQLCNAQKHAVAKSPTNFSRPFGNQKFQTQILISF
jgi:hypothetical protein